MKANPAKKARTSKDIRTARPAARSARVSKKATSKRKS
jgi:hypothetical protein